MQITINELLARIEELENNIFVTVQPEGTTPTLTSISATYNGGNVTTGTNINSLTGITVEGTYSDGTVKTVTGYTLSGTIGEGSNTITVTYEGKTTTFTVIGVASGGTEPEPEPTQYTLTINATPSDAIIKINNVAQKTITVTEGTSVTWEVSKEGYVTQSGTKIVNATETMAITLVEEETGGGDSGGESGDTVTIATLDDFTNMNTLLRFTGVEEAKSAYHCTDFIDISNYSSVTCDVMPKTVSNSPVCWYDADKNYISGVRLDTDTENPTITDYNLQATLTYAVPENAVYAKFGAYAKVTGDGTFNTNYYATITGVLK